MNIRTLIGELELYARRFGDDVEIHPVPDDVAPSQHLVDQLQIIAPLAQRLAITSRQQAHDAAVLLEAAQRAVEEVRQPKGEPS